ncbi:allantoinase [Chloroflexales bacterium ZM16-3]|nr:allantoinase [Chloroflexales bacterium ZM16-3]
MSRYDLIIREGMVVTPGGVAAADVAVSEGMIAAIGPELGGAAREEIAAAGTHVLPAMIDAHVHFNEPGRTHWEGWASGSRALAAGGGALCFEMPLNASPPTLDAASFALKRAAAEASSLADFALWGGLIPGSIDRLDELAACGVIGFKAFMSNSGIDDFRAADDLTLYEGMIRAARLGLPVAVHAESEALTSALATRALAADRTTARDYLASRPVLAELEAIQRALLFAGQTGCALHIVHVSSGAGVALVAEARARGVDVTCETCPHYLALTEDDVERIGAAAKCAPPIRGHADQGELWARLLAGQIDLVASDHSPAPPEMKGAGENFFALWGGIAGVQSTLGILLEEGHHRRGMAMAAVAGLTAGNVARRFGIAARKGQIAPGYDADLALVNLGDRAALRREDLLDRHRLSPYVGRAMGGRVVRTIRRGQTIFADGRAANGAGGALVMPS